MAELDFNVKAVMAVVLILVLFTGLGITALNWKENIADKRCKNSVQIHLKSQISFLSVMQGILKVDKGDIKYNAIDCHTKEPTLKGSDEEMKFQLAEEMRKCWDDFHQGKEPLFTDEGLFCHVCSIVDFKDKKGSLDNFPEYLATTKVPNAPYTYTEFLTNQQSKQGASINDGLAKEIREASLDKQNDYAVVYVFARGENNIEAFQKYLDTDAGNVVIVSGAVGGIGLLLVVAAATPPVGWAALAISGAVVATSVVVGAIANYFVQQEVPYASFLSLEEYNAENLNKVCDIMPIRAIPR